MSNIVRMIQGNREPAAPRAWGVSPFAQMERMMDDLLAGFGMPANLTMPTSTMAFMPKMDVTESDKTYDISAELPGMTEKDVSVDVSGDVLTLSGEKRSEHDDKGKDVYRMERSYGRFQRQFTLPANVDVAKIGAKFSNGVLHVTLPKTAENKPESRKIAVTS